MKRASVALVLIAILAALDLTAQESASAPDPLLDELSALNASMKQIAVLLEQHVAGQETDLLIKRVDLASRTLIARRQELTKTRAEAARLSEEEEPLRMGLESWKERSTRSNVDDEHREAMQFEVEQVEKRLASVETRRKDLERRIMELENEVMTHEEDMRVLEDVLDERLGL